MNAVLIVITVVQLLVALALILIVLFQSGKSQGLSGAIGGIADSYMSRSKAKSMDAKLARCTKWVAAVFVVLTLVLDGGRSRVPRFLYAGEAYGVSDFFRPRPGGAGGQPHGPSARLRAGGGH